MNWDRHDGPRNGEFGSSHQVLTGEVIPPPGSPWYWELLRFSLTFDGYAAYGDRLADVFHANWKKFNETGDLPSDLAELRATLFFLQRYIRWNEESRPEGPTASEMDFAHGFVEAIRAHVPRQATKQTGGDSVHAPKPHHEE